MSGIFQESILKKVLRFGHAVGLTYMSNYWTVIMTTITIIKIKDAKNDEI